MAHRRIDALVRALAHPIGRRQTLAAALALVFAALVADEVDAAQGKGGKGGGKGKDTKKKAKKRRKRHRGGGAARDCTAIPLQPGADLRGCDLREHPGLASANFTRAMLADAVLSGANLSGISFRGARLWRAKLDGANLHGADFDAANGQKTDVFAADFTNANLHGADLALDGVLYASYAIFCNTTMPDGITNDADCPL